jgi:hypothetical protein
MCLSKCWRSHWPDPAAASLQSPAHTCSCCCMHCCCFIPGGQRKPLKLYRRADGQQVAVVWPANMVPAFFPSFVGEVWIQPGQAASQGEIYRHKAEGGLPGPGSVALVLGEW